MSKLTNATMAAVLAVALTVPGMAVAADSPEAGQGKAATKSEAKPPAAAQEKSQGQSSTPGEALPPSPPADQASPTAQAAVDAHAQADAQATIEARKTMDRIKERGAKVSKQARAKAESKIDAVSTKTGEDAAVHGSATVAGRLAAEFGMSTDEIMAEQQALGCSWGALMIAHSLDANTSTDVTAAQLVQLHKEGTGWGQIAAGLGLNLGHVVSAVQAEGRVAAGLAKPDGKVAAIRGDGTRANVGAGAAAGAAAGGVSAATRSGVGVGVKIKP
jgi:hypothetical protein